MSIERLLPGTTKVVIHDVDFHLLNMTNGQKLVFNQKGLDLQVQGIDFFDQTILAGASGIERIQYAEQMTDGGAGAIVVLDKRDEIDTYMLMIKSYKIQREILEAIMNHNDLVANEEKNQNADAAAGSGSESAESIV